MRRQLKHLRFMAGAGAALGVLAVLTATTTFAAGGGRGDGGDRPAGKDTAVVDAVTKVTRSTAWQLDRRLKLDFPAYHPQGLVRVGDKLFLSSVQVLEAPVKYPEPVDGYDRSPGKGIGHVFVLDLKGRLLEDIVVGEGTTYHPGGLDTDGRSVWVPVSEYRPDSAAVVYRIDPRTYRVHEAFRVADHIGGVATDPRSGKVHGITWGSRAFYTWDRHGRQLSHRVNQSHYVDYQDCAFADPGKVVCTGITNFTSAAGAPFELGGIAVLDADTWAIDHEVPVQLWSPGGHVATRNPVLLEAHGDRLRMWAAPDDGEASGSTELLVYTARVG